MSIKKISLPFKIIITTAIIGVVSLGIILSSESKGDTAEPEVKKVAVTLLSLADTRDNSVVAITSGEIESLDQVVLSSEVSGVISSVNVVIGDKVSPGQILAQFRASDKAAQLSQVQADYESSLASKESLYAQIETAKANHEKLILSTQNRINTAETTVQKSENNLTFDTPQETKSLVSDAYNDAYVFLTSVQDTLSKHLQVADNILGIDNEYANNDFKYLLGAKNSSSLSKSKEGYYQASNAKLNLYSKIDALSSSSNSSDIDSALIIAEDALLKMKTLFLDLTFLLDNTITSSNFSQVRLDTLIAGVNASRNDISSKQTQLVNNVQALQGAKDTKETREINNVKNKTDLEITYEKALQDLEDTKKQVEADIYASLAGIKQLETSLLSQDAMIKRAKASISSVQAELAKTTVRSPIGGVIANIAVKKGELISAGKIVAEVVNVEGLQVRAYIPGTALSSVVEGGLVLIEDRPVGKILHIAPSINQATKKVEIIVSITQTDGNSFLVGQFVELKVLGNPELMESQPVLISLQAIKIGSESHEVYVVNDEDIIEPVSVETGKLIGDKIEIISDISMYDAIISDVRGVEVGQLVSITK